MGEVEGAPSVASVSAKTDAGDEEEVGVVAEGEGGGVGVGCLSEEQLVEERTALKTRLLQVMDGYMGVWRMEEKTEEEVSALYDDKKAELKLRLKEKKAALLARACDLSASTSPSSPSTPSVSTRQLQSLDEDDWFDQEEEVLPEELGQGEGAAAYEDEDRGVAARIIAGGSEGGVVVEEAGGAEGEGEEGGAEEEGPDGPLLDASIHPYAFPSAFTELSERDIESRHAPSTPPLTPSHPSSPSDSTEVDIYENGGFVASISPARFDGTPTIRPTMVLADTDRTTHRAAAAHVGGVGGGGKSARERDEDLAEERRTKLSQLRSLRGGGGGIAHHPPQALTEAEYEAGGHFVASISPMAPQRSSRLFEEDEAFIGSIGPPPSGGSRGRRWWRGGRRRMRRRRRRG